MKALLKSLPITRSAFARARSLRQSYLAWKNDPARNLHKILRGSGNLFIVQIGSNDGSTADPIFSLLKRNHSWQALLVEPVPFLFERLRNNYRENPNVRFENIAIAEAAGWSTFYYVDAAAKQYLPELPFWYDQLGSFDREHIRRHLGEAVTPFIVSIPLTTLPLATMLARNGVTAIDVLHIDTEGYDWKILRQLDQERFRPKAILFEHKHLSETDKLAAVAFLTPNYQLTDLGADFLCRRTT